jgi:glycine/D-amino acid oxidase-like deaminating enzyme
MPCKYDVVVVGAGIIGMSTAFHLKQFDSKLSVIVVDRYPRAGMGNTAKSAALYRNVFSSAVNRLLASSSISFYNKIQKQFNIDIGMRYTGYLWFCDEALWETFQVLRVEEKRNGINKNIPEVAFQLKDLSALELLDLFGCDASSKDVQINEGTTLPLPSIAHGILAPQAGTLSPAKLLGFYENQFKELGGELLYRTEVEKITYNRTPGEAREEAESSVPSKMKYGMEKGIQFNSLLTNDGTIKADKICLATGAWTNQLTDPLGINALIKPKTRQLFNIFVKHFKTPKGFANKEERYPIFVLPPDGIYIKPLRLRGNFIVGWADDVGRPFMFEPEPLPEAEFFEKYMRPVLKADLPWLGDAEIKHSWAGQYHYNTIDGNPFIFNEKNLTMVVGASGSGIMKADAIGKITAARILEKTKVELMENVELPVNTLGLESRLAAKEHLII